MLRALISKELRLAWRSRRVWWATAVMSVLAATAAVSGMAEHLARVAEHRALLQLAETSFAGQKADHPHSIAHNGYVVSRPPAPLGFLDSGVQTAYGRWLRLDAHQTRPLAGARTSELARAPGAGRFDLGLLLAMFAPVLMVMLAFDQIAHERAKGTLAMLTAAGMSLWPFVLSKLTGALARAAIAIGTPTILAVIVMAFVVDDVDLPRLSIWLAVHAAAMMVWAVIVLAASSAVSSARSSLVAGIALWGALALFVPPFAGGMSQILAPVTPPGEGMVQAEQWAQSAHAQTESLRNAAIRDIKKRHPDWNGQGEAPEVIDAVMLALADRDASTKMKTLFAALDAEQDRQERWAAALSFVSPSGLASLASSTVAGSDLAHMRAVFLHYETYRQTLMAWFNAWWAAQGRAGFEDYAAEKKFDDFDKAPRPVVPTFSIPFAVRRATLSTGLLFVVGLAAFAAYVALARRALTNAKGVR